MNKQKLWLEMWLVNVAYEFRLDVKRFEHFKGTKEQHNFFIHQTDWFVESVIQTIFW